eukprot:TRINITY_DN34177_c0_g1_i1.p1 TRINITY_DN34177_c0_g1~~TRINITY_DN34177_c0_g1_i1.p1  ORF type:complete len:513 (-),score=79.34 TRINITY_DN34177_c0_g1_i1:308-1777(-)
MSSRLLPAGSGHRSGVLLPGNSLRAFLLHWSLLRNGRSFTRRRQPEENAFACLDSIRVLSMCQVILGHSYIYAMGTVGLTNLEQFLPPNGLMGSLLFMFVPGCFYGVDTFFLMSGFLCAQGLDQKVFCTPQATSASRFIPMYAKFILLRYMRLVPLLVLCMGLVYWILPLLGKGVMWSVTRPDDSHCFDFAGSSHCDDKWWTVVLFIQNVDRYLGKCMAHTWYLAVDFQLYLTAPLFSLVYSLDRRLGWGLLAAAFCLGVVLPVALVASHNLVPDMLLGGLDFTNKVYMKPWCRLSPFLLGIAMAWLWKSKYSKTLAHHDDGHGFVRSLLLSVLALCLLAAATFLRLLFYNCDVATCSNLDTNPAGKAFAYLWAAFSIPCWSLGMAMLMTLCFQGRFLPILQDILHAPFWQPLAKLTYAAYLIHTSVLVLDFCQRNSMMNFTGASFLFGYIAYVFFTMFLAFSLWILFEKPVANMLMLALSGRRSGGSM